MQEVYYGVLLGGDFLTVVERDVLRWGGNAKTATPARFQTGSRTYKHATALECLVRQPDALPRARGSACAPTHMSPPWNAWCALSSMALAYQFPFSLSYSLGFFPDALETPKALSRSYKHATALRCVVRSSIPMHLQGPGALPCTHSHVAALECTAP